MPSLSLSLSSCTYEWCLWDRNRWIEHKATSSMNLHEEELWTLHIMLQDMRLTEEYFKGNIIICEVVLISLTKILLLSILAAKHSETNCVKPLMNTIILPPLPVQCRTKSTCSGLAYILPSDWCLLRVVSPHGQAHKHRVCFCSRACVVGQAMPPLQLRKTSPSVPSLSTPLTLFLSTSTIVILHLLLLRRHPARSVAGWQSRISDSAV